MPRFEPNVVNIDVNTNAWVDIRDVPDGIFVDRVDVVNPELIDGMDINHMNANKWFTVNGRGVPGAGSITAKFSDGSTASLVFTVGGAQVPPAPSGPPVKLTTQQIAAMIALAGASLERAEAMLAASIEARDAAQRYYTCLIQVMSEV